MRQKIGPGHPPRGNRFVKGQSGNPKGRPKQARRVAPSAFDILDRTFTVNDGDVERELPPKMALLMRTYRRRRSRVIEPPAARSSGGYWRATRPWRRRSRRPLSHPDAGAEQDPENADERTPIAGHRRTES